MIVSSVYNDNPVNCIINQYWNMRYLMNSGYLCREAYKAAYAFCLEVKQNLNIEDESWPVCSPQAPTLEEVED